MQVNASPTRDLRRWMIFANAAIAAESNGFSSPSGPGSHDVLVYVPPFWNNNEHILIGLALRNCAMSVSGVISLPSTDSMIAPRRDRNGVATEADRP
jgi:hypothetical protein